MPGKGKTAQDAYRYTQILRMYSLAEANNPPQQRFVDPINERYATLPFYDERYFKDVYDIVSAEPVQPQDKVIMGMLTSLGIETSHSLRMTLTGDAPGGDRRLLLLAIFFRRHLGGSALL